MATKDTHQYIVMHPQDSSISERESEQVKNDPDKFDRPTSFGSTIDESVSVSPTGLDYDKKLGKPESTSTQSVSPADFDIAILEREQEFSYGWGNFRPWWLQRCRNPLFVLAALCLCNFGLSFGIYGVFPTATRHLLLRFYLSVEDLGVIRMMYDVGHLVMLLPVIYFGTQGANRPLWIGCGAVAMGFGAFFTTVPHYLNTGRVPPATSHDLDLCRETNLTRQSQCSDQWLASYKYVFIFANLVYGMGAAPFYTMGLTYMDENVSNKKSAIYTGTFMIFGLIGPAVGLIVAGKLTEIPGDFGRHKEVHHFTEDDQRHYGAWWLGMLIAAFLNWIAAVPLFGFPYRLPGAVRAQMEDMRKRLSRKRCANDDEQKSISVLVPHSVFSAYALKQAFGRCLEVVRNPTYVGLVIDNCAFWFLVTCFGTFLPKYVAKVFQIPISDASGYVAIVVVASILSTLGGTYIQHSFYLSVRGNIRLSLLASLGGLICTGALLVQCPGSPLVGVTVQYPIYVDKSPPKTLLQAPCNADCTMCTQDHFDAVCYTDPNGTSAMFFSGCYAGCLASNSSAHVSTNCSCVPLLPKRKDRLGQWIGGGSVKEGFCTKSCPMEKLFAFLIGASWMSACLYLRTNAVQQSILRCFPFSRRVVSVAIANVCQIIFGSIPSSPIFGHLWEKSCLVFETRCKTSGFSLCAWNDIAHLVSNVTILAYVVSVIGCIGLFVATYTYKRPIDYGECSLKYQKRKGKRAKGKRKENKKR